MISNKWKANKIAVHLIQIPKIKKRLNIISNIPDKTTKLKSVKENIPTISVGI